MQRLRMSVKLTTMAFMLGLPLLVVSYFQLSTLFTDFATTRDEVLGAQAVHLVGEVLTDVQHLRAESVLAGKPVFDKAIASTLQDLQSHIGALDAWVAQHPEL